MKAVVTAALESGNTSPEELYTNLTKAVLAATLEPGEVFDSLLNFAEGRDIPEDEIRDLFNSERTTEH